MAEDVRPGEYYELSRGYRVERMPTGQIGSKANGLGFQVLATDPEAESAGVDAGCSPEPGALRAPDVAVGNLKDDSGWMPGVPPLAVEYADRGQDEQTLATKIRELLGAGTRYIWVVRLRGPRRVEVHEPDRPMRYALPGEELTAPGVLRNPVPVEALYDRQAANRVTLRNLLQQQGYENLDEIRAEGEAIGRAEGEAIGRAEGEAIGRAEGEAQGQANGIAEGKRDTLLRLLDRRGIGLTTAQRRQIESCIEIPLLDHWFDQALTAATAEDLGL